MLRRPLRRRDDKPAHSSAVNDKPDNQRSARPITRRRARDRRHQQDRRYPPSSAHRRRSRTRSALDSATSPGLHSSAPQDRGSAPRHTPSPSRSAPNTPDSLSRHHQARPPPAMAHFQGCNEPPFWGVSHEAHEEPGERGPHSRRNPPLASRPSHHIIDCDHPRGQSTLSLGWQPRERVLRTLHDGR